MKISETTDTTKKLFNDFLANIYGIIFYSIIIISLILSIISLYRTYKIKNELSNNINNKFKSEIKIKTDTIKLQPIKIHPIIKLPTPRKKIPVRIEEIGEYRGYYVNLSDTLTGKIIYDHYYIGKSTYEKYKKKIGTITYIYSDELHN